MDGSTNHAAVDLVVSVGSPGALDMEARPAEATGAEATFRIAFLNQSRTPALLTLAAHDRADGLRFHIEPRGPVIVPASATGVLATVHVIPTVRKTMGPPHLYEIEFRGRHVGHEDANRGALVAQARFVYVPRPARLRRLPVLILALLLALALVLLLWAHLATQPTAGPPAVPTPGLSGVAPRQPLATGPRAAVAPPVMVLNPERLHFSPQDVSTTSAARTIYIVNLGPTALTIARVTIAGPNPGDFRTSVNCAGATIRAYDGCTLSIRFTPHLGGPRRARLVIADNAVDRLQTVLLSGTGRRPLSSILSGNE